MSLDELRRRIAANRPLSDVLAVLEQVPSGALLEHRDVMAMSHYVRRLGVAPSDPAIERLVKFVNERFIQPMFDPALAGSPEYEPKAVVFGLDRFPSPSDVRAILEELLERPTFGTFQTLVKRHGERRTVAIVSALVARTPRDLLIEAGGAQPASTKLQRIWRLVDAVVRGARAAPPPAVKGGPQPRRPLELLFEATGSSSASAWAYLRRLLAEGVPYELLVLQRMIGTPFGTAQNASSEQVAGYLSDLFLQRYALGVPLPFLRTVDGAAAPYPPYVSKREMERLTGVFPSPDIAFVRPVGQRTVKWQDQTIGGYAPSPGDYSSEDVVAVVEAKVASDGGTARQKCDELRRQLASFSQRPGLLAAALIEGSGWNQRRAETARLALDLAGHIYRLRTADLLVQAIKERA